ALDYRRRTGKGQYIDVSQTEAAAVSLAPAMLDFAFNGRVMERLGNRQPDMAPHGMFPCLGHNRWIAISCRHDGDWQRLCAAMGNPEWSRDGRLQTLPGRIKEQDAIEQQVARWTLGQEPHMLMER